MVSLTGHVPRVPEVRLDGRGGVTAACSNICRQDPEDPTYLEHKQRPAQPLDDFYSSVQRDWPLADTDWRTVHATSPECMKILYVGTERDEAQAIATAVSGLGERVSVSWTSGLDQVVKWIDETHGLRVLVVGAQPNG